MSGYGRLWTPEEIAILRAEYGMTSSASLALRLGRTQQSIRGRAFRLGLVKERKARPERLPPVPIEQVHAIAVEVERRRQEHAARMAGCPLERWLMARGTPMKGMNNGGARKCGCSCHLSSRNFTWAREAA